MEKLIKLLKKTSDYTSHRNNLAKEYIIKGDSILTMGYDCFKTNDSFYEIIDNKAVELDRKECTLCYGISISNVVSMIEKAGEQVVSIFRDQDKEYGYYSCYYLTIKSKCGRLETIRFNETVSMKDFCGTELYHHLLHLYEID